MGAAPHRGRWHHARAQGAKIGFGKTGEAGGDLVIKAAEAAVHELVVLQPEGQQHGLLQPFVDLPAAAGQGFGDAALALFQQRQRLLDRATDRTGRFLGRE